VTPEAVRELLHATPFAPFTIHIPDRPPIRVQHPDFVALPPNAKTMVVYLDDGESFRVLDVRLITAFERTPAPDRG
jgi:hypothetical protein